MPSTMKTTKLRCTYVRPSFSLRGFRLFHFRFRSFHHQKMKHFPIGRFPLLSPPSALHQSPFHPECAFVLLLLIRLVKFCSYVFLLLRIDECWRNTKYSVIRKELCSVNHYIVECPMSTIQCDLIAKISVERNYNSCWISIVGAMVPFSSSRHCNLCGETMTTQQQNIRNLSGPSFVSTNNVATINTTSLLPLSVTYQARCLFASRTAFSLWEEKNPFIATVTLVHYKSENRNSSRMLYCYTCVCVFVSNVSHQQHRNEGIFDSWHEKL